MMKSLKDGLASAAARLKRAEKFLQEFDELEEAYLSQDPITYNVTQHAGIGALLSYAVNVPPPTELGSIADDAIGNMRESLDHALFAFAEVSGLTTEKEFKALQFPTGDTLALFETALKARTKGLDPRVIETIRDLKPYLEGDYNAHQGSWLEYLHQLSNSKKHRTITPTPTFSGYSQIELGIMKIDPKLQRFCALGFRPVCSTPSTLRISPRPSVCFPGNDFVLGKSAAYEMRRIFEVCSGTVLTFGALADREFSS